MSNSVVTWNCRSLRSKIACIKSFLVTSQPLVLLVLTETWPQVWQSKDAAVPVTARDSEHCLQVPGYSLFNIPVNAKSIGHGGLAFYVRSNVTCDVATFTITATTVTQVAWLAMHLPVPVLVGACYLLTVLPLAVKKQQSTHQ